MDMGPTSLKPRQLREFATRGSGKIDRGSSDSLNLLGLCGGQLSEVEMWLEGSSCGTGKTARG